MVCPVRAPATAESIINSAKRRVSHHLLGLMASPVLLGLQGIMQKEFKQLPYQPGKPS